MSSTKKGWDGDRVKRLRERWIERDNAERQRKKERYVSREREREREMCESL